jgi:two-component system, chemotaxis family, response regulator Rcp1
MNEKRNFSPVKILLVEDNPADVGLVEEALKEAKILHELAVAEDGVQALEFLHQTGDFTEAVLPDIIFLDLNLPRKTGREVLEEIKNDPKLQQIPVIVLTSSEAEEDIAKAYRSHANCFITKPPDLDSFIKIVSTIECFWFTIVKLPKTTIRSLSCFDQFS